MRGGDGRYQSDQKCKVHLEVSLLLIVTSKRTLCLRSDWWYVLLAGSPTEGPRVIRNLRIFNFCFISTCWDGTNRILPLCCTWYVLERRTNADGVDRWHGMFSCVHVCIACGYTAYDVPQKAPCATNNHCCFYERSLCHRGVLF